MVRQSRGHFRAAGNEGVEGAVRDAAAASKRVSDYTLKQARYAHEEGGVHVQEMQSQGLITAEDAQKLRARNKMHGKTTEFDANMQMAAAAADYQTTEQMLEETLDTTIKNPFLKCISRVLCIQPIIRRVRNERSRRSHRDFIHPFPRIDRIVRTTWFEAIFGIVMVANGVLIGAQVNSMGDESGATSEATVVLEHLFAIIFITELALRVTSEGWTWFFRLANFADCTLVIVTGALPIWVLEPLFKVKGEEMRFLAVLRTLRLVRLVRMIRTLPWFRILWTLIRGLLDSFWTLIWTWVMVGTVLFILSVFSVYMIGRADVFRGDQVVLEFFGSVPECLFTLFQFITLDSWYAPGRLVMDKSGSAGIMLIVSILVVTTVLLNLVTAVIVNNAMARAAQDQEFHLVLQVEETKKQIQELRNVFAEIDSDGSGTLSREEFFTAVQTNDNVIQKFKVLEIGPGQVDEIWELIDTGCGEIHVDQFAESLRAMQAGAKAKDSFSIVRRVMHVNRNMVNCGERLRQMDNQCSELKQEAGEVSKLLVEVMKEMKEFIDCTGICIPAKAAPRSAQQIEAFDEQMTKVVETFL
mmetsp:Transcript_118099/g.252366  ORF Transcript_118099/g.252366 Transcript_118099/m.252366 type:complete len:583 (-) Transcript_118099:107-1855(-)